MSIVGIINLVFNVFYVLLLARIVLSWIRVDPYHPTWGSLVRFVYNATEPILGPVRRLLPPMGGLDFSPIIVLLVASLLKNVLISLLI